MARDSSGSAQALLSHAQPCSPSAQLKAAATHVQRLKWNQRKKRLILSLGVSRAWNPYNPAINCARPPQKNTKGKKIVGEFSSLHQFTVQEAVMKVEPTKPARPRAAGGAMGLRKMLTWGYCSRTEATLSSFVLWRAMVGA